MWSLDHWRQLQFLIVRLVIFVSTILLLFARAVAENFLVQLNNLVLRRRWGASSNIFICRRGL